MNEAPTPPNPHNLAIEIIRGVLQRERGVTTWNERTNRFVADELLKFSANLQATHAPEIDRLKRVIERDRTEVARILGLIRLAIEARRWLTDGRGSFEYDDGTYQHEIRQALDEIGKATKRLATLAGDLSDSPTDRAEIDRARKLLAAGGGDPYTTYLDPMVGLLARLLDVAVGDHGDTTLSLHDIADPAVDEAMAIVSAATP